MHGDVANRLGGFLVWTLSEADRAWVHPAMQRIEERRRGKVLLALDDPEDGIPETQELVDPRAGHHPCVDPDGVPDAWIQGRAAHLGLYCVHQHAEPDSAVTAIAQPPIGDLAGQPPRGDPRLRVREVVADDTQRVLRRVGLGAIVAHCLFHEDMERVCRVDARLVCGFGDGRSMRGRLLKRRPQLGRAKTCVSGGGSLVRPVHGRPGAAPGQRPRYGAPRR